MAVDYNTPPTPMGISRRTVMIAGALLVILLFVVGYLIFKKANTSSVTPGAATVPGGAPGTTGTTAANTQMFLPTSNNYTSATTSITDSTLAGKGATVGSPVNGPTTMSTSSTTSNAIANPPPSTPPDPTTPESTPPQYWYGSLNPMGQYRNTAGDYVSPYAGHGTTNDQTRYIVQPGDTLGSIAQKTGWAWQDIYLNNNDIFKSAGIGPQSAGPSSPLTPGLSLMF